MQKSHLQRHELLFSRTVEFNYPASRRLNHKKSSAFYWIWIRNVRLFYLILRCTALLLDFAMYGSVTGFLSKALWIYDVWVCVCVCVYVCVCTAPCNTAQECWNRTWNTTKFSIFYVARSWIAKTRLQTSCWEVGGWGRDPKKCTGRDCGMGSSTI